MRVLLTRLSAFGDIVHTWPLAEALTRGEPPVQLAWAVEEAFVPLIAGHPSVSCVIPIATRRWRRRPFDAATRREFRHTRDAMRGFAPEVVIDPQGLMKSAAWGLLSGAPERVGLARSHRRELPAGVTYTRTVAPPLEARHVVDINLSLSAAVGKTARFGGVPDAGFLLGSASHGAPGPAVGSVALVPATGGRGKEWPAESYALLARKLTAAGTPVVVVWGPGERALAQSVVASAGDGTTLTPPTSIPELALLMSTCAAVVGGDTGPVHLAAALGVPTVAIFIATEPERNGPRGARAITVSAARGPARRGSARSSLGGDVEVAEVLAALKGLLDGARPGAS